MMNRLVVLAAVTLPGCSDDGTGPPIDAVDDLQAVEVVSGLVSPVHLTAPAGDARLFIVDQPGVIYVVRDGNRLATPFLDISDEVAYGGERGLFSMAFDPEYDSTGLFWVNYTDNAGDTRVERELYILTGSGRVYRLDRAAP